MKLNANTLCLLTLTVLTSCSNNDEPDFPVFMQPASITTDDINGGNQTFEYNENGKIAAWTLRYGDNERVTARYFYPGENIIKIESEEVSFETRTFWSETIQLVNGRASESEGTFILQIDDVTQIQKTYRLEFTYTPDNHLNIIKHSEVRGIGGNVTADDWDNSWNWENYLIWSNGNLIEYQNFLGNSTVYQTTKFDYSTSTAAYPVIIPDVINSLHHRPLFMQGVFGSNSKNLLESSSIFDEDGKQYSTRHYTYKFNKGDLIDRYVATISDNTAFSKSISYIVNWTDK